MEDLKRRCWCDLDRPVKVCQLRGNTLIVWDEGEGLWTTHLHDGVLLPLDEEITVGTWLRLQNVCVRHDGTMEIAPSSRVTIIAGPCPPSPVVEDKKEPPTPLPPPPSKWKWKCPSCRYTNFPSKGVCHKCNKTRTMPQKQQPPQRLPIPQSRRSSPLTEVVATTEDIPNTPLVDLLPIHRPKNWKYLVECHVRGFLPSDIHHFTQQDKGTGEWRYFLQLTLADGHVSLPVLVCDPLFFHTLPPCDFFANNGSLDILTRKMDRLCCSTAGRVRLAIQSYVPQGREERVFQVFGTILI